MLLSAICSQAQMRMSLEECLTLAEQNNIGLKAADANVERARIMQGTAWDVDKTELSLAQDPTSGGSPDNAIAISQQIEFPTVYIARHKQLKAETRAERSRRSVVLNALHADIMAAYYELLYCEEQKRLLLAQDSLLTRYADIAETRYKAGEARQIESLSARRMLRENTMQATVVDTEIAAARQRLQTLVGSDMPIMPFENVLHPISYNADLSYNYAASSEGKYAQHRMEALNRAVATARNGWAPSLSVALKNQLVITGWDPYHENRSRYTGGNFMGFEVGVGLPLFFGATKAKVRAARKERDIAQLEMQRDAIARQGEYATALAKFAAANQRLSYYNGQGIESATEITRLGALEYENGEIDYVEYVNVLQESIDTQMKRAAAINDYNQAVVEMERIRN